MSLQDVYDAFPKPRPTIRTNTTSTLTGRLWKKVDRTTTCWTWLGGKDSAGYGTFCVNLSNRRAHTVVYLLVKGRDSLPSHCVLDHLCHFPSCVNPDHLEPVSCEENTRRATAYLKAGGKRQTRPISLEAHTEILQNNH